MNNLEKNIQSVAIDAAKQVAREDFEILGRKLIAHCDAYKTRPEADPKISTVMAYLAEFFAEAFNIPQPKPVPLQRRRRVETKSLLWDSRERTRGADRLACVCAVRIRRRRQQVMSDTNATWSMFWSRPGDPGTNSKHERADNLGRDVTVTEAPYQEQQIDGSTEHGPLRVLVNGKPLKPESDRHLPDHLGNLTPQERMANQQNYGMQVEVARSVIPNFDEVAYQKSVALPQTAVQAIAQGGLPNAARVQYYLGSHPDVAAEMCTMTPKQVQERLKDISVRLQTDWEGMELDKADFATYRRVRARQEAERRR